MFLLGKLLLKLVASTLIIMDNPNDQISTEEQAVDEIVYRQTRRNNRAAASTEEDTLVFRRAIVSRILKGPKPTINYNICRLQRSAIVAKTMGSCSRDSPFYVREQRNHPFTHVLRICVIVKESY